MNEYPGVAPRMTESEAGFLESMAEMMAYYCHGDFAEVGVYQGGSAILMGLHSKGRRLHLFDTFRGNPPELRQEWELPRWDGSHRCSLASVKQNMDEWSMGDEAIYHVGDIQETQAEVSGYFSLVHIDVDLYVPTLVALRCFWPRLESAGGRIVVHDYQHPEVEGVTRAVDEFCAESGAVAAQVSTPGNIGQALLQKGEVLM